MAFARGFQIILIWEFYINVLGLGLRNSYNIQNSNTLTLGYLTQKDDGFLLSGTLLGPTPTKMVLIKLSKAMDLEWARTYQDQSDYYGRATVQDSGGDIFLIKAPLLSTYRQISVAHISSDGSEDWELQIGAAGQHQQARGLTLAESGGIIVVGYTQSEGAGIKDAFIAKLDEKGIRQWMKVIGGANTDSLSKVVKLENGDYIVCVQTLSGSGGGQKIMLIRFSESGVVQWIREIGQNSGFI